MSQTTRKTDAEILASNAEFWRQNPNFDVKCMDYIDYPKENQISHLKDSEKRRSSSEWARRLSLKGESEGEGEPDKEFLRRKAKREERWKRQSVKIVAVSPWERIGLSQEGQADVERAGNKIGEVKDGENDSAERAAVVEEKAEKTEDEWVIVPDSPKTKENV